MAITQDYVSVTGTEGNDYKGATFTDGAYTKATKTLTKAGAFTASKVNHYIYITGTHITSGYYKISDVSGAPNAVILATEASSDGNDSTDVHCTQHAGTALLPWRSLQGAFDLLTRNASDGNQVNLKSGTAQVNAAALDLTVFVAGSALAAAAPLIVRGYAAAANDGGVGEIDCGGATMFAETTYDYIWLVDLEIHSGGDNNLCGLDANCLALRCEFHKGASSPSGKHLLVVAAAGRVEGCYFHDPGADAARCISSSGFSLLSGNYVDSGADATGTFAVSHASGIAMGNIVVIKNTGQNGISSNIALGNVVFSTVAATGYGLYNPVTAMNNILCGFSGVGGDGLVGTNLTMLGYNAFYNNTNNNTVSDQIFADLTASDVALGADPFTSAATGDFSLTAAGKAALRGLGWPGAYLGAHASTDGHVTIGPIQYGEAEAGGGVYNRVMRLLGG
jgi:hypothetical protein